MWIPCFMQSMTILSDSQGIAEISPGMAMSSRYGEFRIIGTLEYFYSAVSEQFINVECMIENSV